MPNIKDVNGLHINGIPVVDKDGTLTHPNFTSLQADYAKLTTNFVQQTRNIVPKNLLKDEGVPLLLMNSATSWWKTDNVVVVNSMENAAPNKSWATKVTFPGLGGKMISIAKDMDMSDMEWIGIAFEIPVPYNWTQLVFEFSNTLADQNNGWAAWTNKARISIDVSLNLREGWNYIILDKADFTLGGTFDWAELVKVMKFTFSTNSTKYSYAWGATSTPVDATVDIKLGGMWKNPKGFGSAILFDWDDTLIQMWDHGAPMLHAAQSPKNPNGIICNMSLCTDHTNKGGYMLDNHINTLYERGWSIANHSKTHATLPDLSTSEMIEEFSYCEDFRKQRGWTRGLLHATAPYGRIAQNSVDVMKSLGFKSCRGSTARPIVSMTIDPTSGILNFPTYEIINTTTLVDFKAWIAKSIKYQCPISIFSHGVYDATAENTPTYNVAKTVFQTMVNEVVKQDVACLNREDFYNLLTNPYGFNLG